MESFVADRSIDLAGAETVPARSAGISVELTSTEPIQNYALTVAYNGAPFCGFARQPGQKTVQGELEQALRTVFGLEIPTVCAGRTDAGVHARGQVVNFLAPLQPAKPKACESLRRSLNALTDDAIVVREVREVPQDFSARFSAKAREYHYFIAIDSTPPLFMRDFSWFMPKPLNVEAMRQAAHYLIGEHDFKSFCMAVSAIDKPTCRYVESITFEQTQIMGESVLVMTIIGNAFLHSMVRTIMGTLMMVGRGLREPEWVRDVLLAKDRCAAGENAPAQGLVFWNVRY